MSDENKAGDSVRQNESERMREQDADSVSVKLVLDQMREIASLKQQLAARQTLYHELLMAVESKWPGETRHQTALRYIRQAERSTTTGPAQEFKMEELK